MRGIFYRLEHSRGHCAIEVIDIIKHPDRAHAAQVVTIDTLVRTWPQPIRTFIGDLSDSERLLRGLDLQLKAAIMASGKALEVAS